MAILALTLRETVDVGGISARLISEKVQGLPCDRSTEYWLRTCTDLGLVRYENTFYYATLYREEVEVVDEDN